MITTKYKKNILITECSSDKKWLMMSDIHWDNPKCKRDILKKHLDMALEQDMGIVINGDFFCLMQGKWDPRRSKKDIRPEHNVHNYLDAVIEDAVNWWSPYAQNIAWIGYGNHECYRYDTEVLTDRGWVKITDVTTDDLVATFDSNNVYYENPNAVVSKKTDALYTIEGTYTKQVVSSKHAVMFNNMEKINAEDLMVLSKSQKITEADLPHGRVKIQDDIERIPKWIELLTAVVMDATIVNHAKYQEKSNKIRIQFKLSKERKIGYIKELLEANGIEYTFTECKKTGLNKLQPYYIRIYGDDARRIFKNLGGEKKIPSYLKDCNKSEFLAMINAIKNTDANITGSSMLWTSTDKDNVDVVQSACINNGWNCKYSEHDSLSAFKNGKKQYKVLISEELKKSKKLSITREDYDGDVYCLNMPSGCFITRIDGKVAFSGNTAIIKNTETDPLQRFVDLMNYKNKTSIYTGGYGGWWKLKMKYKSHSSHAFNMKYYHGSGGGGPVTKGVIQNNRMGVMISGADCIWQGHVHELYHVIDSQESLEHNPRSGYSVKHRYVHHIRTAAYKEEYGDGEFGYHIEKGRPPKPIGSYILSFDYVIESENGSMANMLIPNFVQLRDH